MGQEILSDELWGVLAPLFPAPPARPQGGRCRSPNRATLTGLRFALRSGIPWELLPPELGCGSGMTCGRRRQGWQAMGGWATLHRALVDCLGAADQSEWSRAGIDSAPVPAPRGARTPGRIRRSAAKRARSALWWSTATGSRWPSPSGGPMSRTSR
jgi:transposase